MTRVVVAVDGPRADELAAELIAEGVVVVAVVGAHDPAEAASVRDTARGAGVPLGDADALVLQVDRRTLTRELLDACDRLGVRIVPLAAGAAETRFVEEHGLAAALPLDAGAWLVADAVSVAAPAHPLPRFGAAGAAEVAPESTIIAVWGPAGAPGRSTVAVELAVELARGGRRVALIDADVHAPSTALALGLADEGPGFAAACRQAERGGLDATELTRISAPLSVAGGSVDVLTGINRPSRWPELSDVRVTKALEACRDWAEFVVVDVAASLEADEEIVSDLDGPRRNAATLAALRAADLVVAVAAADPVGVSRFVRAWGELRAVVGATRVAVVANKLRPGALGIDARGQVRGTLDRFAGIPEVAFLPLDPRSADAAILSARPIAEVSPKSPFTLALRRFVGEVVAPVLRASEPDVLAAARRGRRMPRAPREQRLTA